MPTNLEVKSMNGFLSSISGCQTCIVTFLFEGKKSQLCIQERRKVHSKSTETLFAQMLIQFRHMPIYQFSHDPIYVKTGLWPYNKIKGKISTICVYPCWLQQLKAVIITPFCNIQRSQGYLWTISSVPLSQITAFHKKEPVVLRLKVLYAPEQCNFGSVYEEKL